MKPRTPPPSRWPSRVPEGVPPPPRVPPSSFRLQPFSAFTLVELITVLTIISFLVATAVGAYFAWNKASALRGAADLTLSGLGRARQFAITHRVDTFVCMDNATSLTNRTFFIICTNAGDSVEIPRHIAVAPPQPLPAGVFFDNPDRLLCFKPRGCVAPETMADWDAGDDGEIIITLILQRGEPGGGGVHQTLRLDPLTGHARPEPRQTGGAP